MNSAFQVHRRRARAAHPQSPCGRAHDGGEIAANFDMAMPSILQAPVGAQGGGLVHEQKRASS